MCTIQPKEIPQNYLVSALTGAVTALTGTCISIPPTLLPLLLPGSRTTELAVTGLSRSSNTPF